MSHGHVRRSPIVEDSVPTTDRDQVIIIAITEPGRRTAVGARERSQPAFVRRDRGRTMGRKRPSCMLECSGGMHGAECELQGSREVHVKLIRHMRSLGTSRAVWERNRKSMGNIHRCITQAAARTEKVASRRLKFVRGPEHRPSVDVCLFALDRSGTLSQCSECAPCMQRL